MVQDGSFLSGDPQGRRVRSTRNQTEAMKNAKVLGMAGCYPTSIQLGLMPLLEKHRLEGGIVDLSTEIIADSKSGISGAGKKADVSLICAEATDNFKAYGAAGHRHTPEIAQQLTELAGEQVDVVFQPHLLPTIRGIFSTIYVHLTHKGAELDIQKLYEDRYQNEYFVDVMPAGSCRKHAWSEVPILFELPCTSSQTNC